MEKMEIYNKVREVPQNAQKPIQAGRLKGMTDINPMWRIKTLTEQFGVCGIGWYYEVTDRHLDTIADSKEVVATVQINLYIKIGDEWSKPINGIGGSKIASMERNGLYVDDECFKKATTDALGVACKNLGVGADVYWDKDTDKYIDPKKDNYNEQPSTQRAPSNRNEQTDALTKKIYEYATAHNMDMKEIAKDYNLTNTTATAERLQEVYNDLTSVSTADSNASTVSEQESMPDFSAIDEEVPFN